jgi:molecular chaperone DnaK (HSP70)
MLVYDFGRETLYISILHVSEGHAEVMGSDGDDRLSGVDFDAAVANVLASRHGNILKDLA